mmetsp:Transcript_22259/g.26748  ORF Transcript_22259/g.26748 Transcript_22259/m.26748 type:complete len:318 (+) Transcript_22259:114-1067(+)
MAEHLQRQLAAVETTTELHEIAGLLGLAPDAVHGVTIDPHLGASIHSVEHQILLKSSWPGQTEQLLELLLLSGGRVEVLWLAEGSLVGNGVVVVVHEHILLDGLVVNGTIGRHCDTLSLELLLHQLDNSLSDCMRLHKHVGHVGAVHGVGGSDTSDLACLLDALVGVDVLERVEERHLGTVKFNLRILGPGHDGVLRDASLQEGGTEGIISELGSEPVHALSKSLERAGRGVNAVVTNVGDIAETEFLVLVKDGAAKSSLGSSGGISGTEHLAAEVLPRALGPVPADGQVVNRSTLLGVLLTHGHEETIDSENVTHG